MSGGQTCTSAVLNLLLKRVKKKKQHKIEWMFCLFSSALRLKYSPRPYRWEIITFFSPFNGMILEEACIFPRYRAVYFCNRDISKAVADKVLLWLVFHFKFLFVSLRESSKVFLASWRTKQLIETLNEYGAHLKAKKNSLSLIFLLSFRLMYYLSHKLPGWLCMNK